MNDLIFERLRTLDPRTRKVVYDLVLVVAGALAVLCWVMPIFGLDHLGPVSLASLSQVSIGAAAVAAVLARLNVPDEEVEHNSVTPGQHRA